MGSAINTVLTIEMLSKNKYSDMLFKVIDIFFVSAHLLLHYI